MNEAEEIDRLVQRIHERWSRHGSQPLPMPVQSDEVAALDRRVQALRQFHKCFAHVRLSGFTEESDGQRVMSGTTEGMRVTASV